MSNSNLRNMLKLKKILIVISSILIYCGNILSGDIWKPDRLFIEQGISKNVESIKFGMNFDWNSKWFENRDSFLSGNFEFSAARWKYINDKRSVTNVIDYSITPVFKYHLNYSESLSLNFECAVGFHLLSDSYKNMGRNLGGAFQFGDHVGVGIKAGKNSNFAFTYRFQHISNAGLEKHNEGINFHQFRIEFIL